MSKVAIVMGSKNDFPAVEPAAEALKKFGVETVIRVLSAHRTPEAVKEFTLNARKNGIEIIIAAAGKAAHLAGVIAGYTTLPVIGLPVKSSTLDGLDSLLSMVQMPNGIPVATVAINGAQNAGLLAVQILALKDKALTQKLEDFKKEMAEAVLEDDKEIQ